MLAKIILAVEIILIVFLAVVLLIQINWKFAGGSSEGFSSGPPASAVQVVG